MITRRTLLCAVPAAAFIAHGHAVAATTDCNLEAYAAQVNYVSEQADANITLQTKTYGSSSDASQAGQDFIFQDIGTTLLDGYYVDQSEEDLVKGVDIWGAGWIDWNTGIGHSCGCWVMGETLYTLYVQKVSKEDVVSGFTSSLLRDLATLMIEKKKTTLSAALVDAKFLDADWQRSSPQLLTCR